MIGKVYLLTFATVREVYYFIMRAFVCEPLLRAAARECGTGVRTGVFVPWIDGHGQLLIRDRVSFAGKLSVTFARRFSDDPVLEIGLDTHVGHDCQFVVAKSISIGMNCLLASRVRMLDSPGHQLSPEARLAGLPPTEEDIKPVVVGNNVWIGAEAILLPGSEIGEGSVVATRAVVRGIFPPRSLIAGVPARLIRSL